MLKLIGLDDPDFAAAIDIEIEHLQASGALGRSAQLKALFIYLVERSRAGSSPREIEIAQDVFSRSHSTGDDGISRVYVHRLRRRLDLYYVQVSRPLRLSLPIGEYRLLASVADDKIEGANEPIPDPVDLPAMPAPERGRSPAVWGLAGAGLAFLACAIIYASLSALAPSHHRYEQLGIAAARSSSLWSSLVDRDGLLVVEGDYYLFAEFGPDLTPSRLIHDLNIGSRDDLNAYLLMHPADASRYGDVGLNYLPFSTSFAQMEFAPLLTGIRGLQVGAMSKTSPARLLTQNILYLGLTSGLGSLAEPLFAGSRFGTGMSFDEIKDLKTKRTYVGETGMDDTSGQRRQYGIVSSFPGSQGNRYLVVAGTGDLALVGLSEAMIDPKHLAELEPYARKEGSFEALYQIDGQHTIISSVHLVAVSLRDPAKIWMAQ
ncbi:MAG: hypothetical protein ACRYG4_25925 [Janthinobacterium lividum]